MGKELKPLYSGDRFGRLTVISKDEKKSLENKKPYYYVQCDCGSPQKSVLKSTLVDKRHPLQSCGCLVKEKAGFESDRGYALKKLLYGKMKDRHIKTLKCAEMSVISFDEFCKRIAEPCAYCGTVNSSYISDRRTSYSLYYNGLDRLDSAEGYTEKNTVAACKWCNISKSEMTVSEFKEYITRLHNYQREKIDES